MSTDVSSALAVIRTRERVLVGIRWAAVAFGLVQLWLYDPGTVPGRAVGYGLLLLLAVANLGIAWASRRLASLGALQTLGVGALTLDMGVMLGFTYLYSFQEFGSTWLILYLAPLEAALRYGLRGTLLTAAAISLLYLPREPYRELVYGYPANFRSEVFRLGILWIVALFAGFMARGLERERDQARRVAEQQTTLLEQLRAFDRLKADFIASTSHELRTPLAIITGFAELLQTRYRSMLADEPYQYVGQIARAGRRLTHRLEMLLDFSVLEGAPLALDLQRVALGRLVREVLDLYGEVAAGAGVSLSCTVDEALEVEADPRRLRAALSYLVDNGIKFNRAGGRVDVMAHGRDGVVAVAVADTGTGMAPEVVEAVFLPFHRGVTGDTAVHGGQGLGLTLARRIIEAHGGRIDVESEPGAGSTFRLMLPLDRGASSPSGG